VKHDAKEQVVNVGAIVGTIAIVHEAWRRGIAGAFRIPTPGDVGRTWERWLRP